MKTWIIRIVIVSASVMLAGCQGTSLKPSDLENDVIKNEQVIDVVTKDPTIEENEVNQNEQPLSPAVVTLIDPRTLEIVTSIIPEQLGFETKNISRFSLNTLKNE